MTQSGQWLPKISTVHNPYPHGLGQGTKPQKYSNHSNLSNTPTNGLSFPRCLFHPRSVHLLCHTVHRLLHPPFLGLQQQAGPRSLRSPWLLEFQLPSKVSRYPLGLIRRKLSPHFSLQGSSLLQGNPRRSVHTLRSTKDPQGKIYCLQSTSSPSYSL